MFNFRDGLLGLVLVCAAATAFAQGQARYAGIGRDATPKEVAAWDIDVRPDFKGLPAGSGSVAKGQDVWEAKCAHCHGFFGESGEVFSPLVGGVTPDDIKMGRVANLRANNFPGRTTFMKVATLSTVWDYINRAMPWNAPKTLTTEEVYATTAFLLNLSGIVPDNFVLSDKNIHDVQAKMPNRNGMTTAHALWPGKEFNASSKPDTSNVACMKDCADAPQLASVLPDFARNAHGNLAEQNRLVGAQHGADTSQPERKRGSVAVPATAEPVRVAGLVKAAEPGGIDTKQVNALLAKNSCTACHSQDKKIIGPAFNEIAKKHAGKPDYLARKIKSGGSGAWGAIPMPAQSLTDVDAMAIANWLAQGAAK